MPYSRRTAEERRLRDDRQQLPSWKLWGPYLSERQWGTVREDYSPDGNAWDYFPHDHARSRAYRWGEDGLGGISDDKQRLCFALALWNGVDPILKERLFGLTNTQGNHGEDVKEYYFYLDNTPTHAYMKYLYKYPQREFPYERLVAANRARSREEFEFELLDTGIFDEDRYFDVFIEYAKASPTDILIRVTAENCGPAPAPLHLLPTVWFRNTWAWHGEAEIPSFRLGRKTPGATIVHASASIPGTYTVCFGGDIPVLFCDNETNTERLFGTPNPSRYAKDGIHDYVIQGTDGAVNPQGTGTKAAAHYVTTIPPGGNHVVKVRLSATPLAGLGEDFDAVFAQRHGEADEFYGRLMPPGLSEDERRVMRQALAGMLWTKQYYSFDLDRWLREHDAHPLTGSHRSDVRNRHWYHMVNDDVISMPDKWEYPWYAAWDLAFHTIPLGMVDPEFARGQLNLMLGDSYMHPNGQIPAYEWNFSDVNPPVHAWATLFTLKAERQLGLSIELKDIESTFHRLLMNFTWWVNRKDPAGRNLFEGGFLGLDNIGVFDRSAKLPTGGYLEQADGTAWMAFYCQNMLELALEVAVNDPAYEAMAQKFLQHFLWIAAAMDRAGEHLDELWDETDGFFYDLLRLPDGSAIRLKVQSMVGLLPFCAVTVVPADALERFPAFLDGAREFISRRPELMATIAPPGKPGARGRRLLALLTEEKLRRILAAMLDESRFLSPCGIRSLSRQYRDHPYTFDVNGTRYTVRYEPAESSSGMFGGNSNWRGPVWFPVNILIVRSLLQYYLYFGDTLRVECPTGSGHAMNLFEVAKEISRRLSGIFLRDASGRRPVYGDTRKFQEDPRWRDYILFYEYFHGDNGAGIGASHQTGWTGAVAKLLQAFGHLTAEEVLDGPPRPLAQTYRPPGM